MSIMDHGANVNHRDEVCLFSPILKVKGLDIYVPQLMANQNSSDLQFEVAC